MATEPGARGARLLALAVDVALFAAAVLLGRAVTAARGFDVELESYHLTGALVARGRLLPLVGPPVGLTNLRLGPAYFYLLGACERLTLDPRLPGALALAGFGLAVVVARRAGRPWGAAAALLCAGLVAGNAGLLAVLFDDRHAMFAILPVAVAVGAALHHARTGRARSFAVALGAAGLGLQFHAVVAVVLGALLLAGAGLRAPRRGWVAGLGAVLLIHLPWLAWYAGRHELPVVRALGAAAVGVGEAAPSLHQATGVPALLLAAALAVLVVAFAAARDPAARRTTGVLLALAGLPVGLYLVGYRHFTARYGLIFHPAVELAVAAAAATIADALSRRLKWRHPISEGVVPVNEGVLPVNEGVLPVNEWALPVNEGVLPVNEGVAPVNEGVAPVNEGVLPVNEVGDHVSDGGHYVSDGIQPVSEGRKKPATATATATATGMPLSEQDV
ncbi:MAG TPA: hypothetical protein VKW77_02485, partial [Acidimicrobiales bacterium]|nr:hypothetical protein [Acidimicrobiales bacterium]